MKIFIIQAKKFLEGDWLNEWYFISMATDGVVFLFSNKVAETARN